MASRDRTARVPVLGSSVRRSRSDRYPSRGRAPLYRRLLLAILVLAALALLTISFRSPTAGALHDVQGAGATALRPFQLAAERVARPFRDVYGYFSGLANAKSENEKLRKELRDARAVANANTAAAQRSTELESLLRFEQGPQFPKDYRAVNTTVISYPSTAFAQEVTIAAGSSSGIRIDTPVVTGDGLIGRVTNVFPHTAQVTLLTDPDNNVPARDVSSGVSGLIRHGDGSNLILDRVGKDQTVKKGDYIVTQGTVDRRYPSIYPYGIPIGRVLSWGLSDTATFQTITVAPYASFDSLDAVAALISTKKR
ncbi:MAG TPA: rod shape-determining protein MreC [Gaiellaceae bacterium]|nr:rod shape-determining protein MreC [Gaiellaceae bacterium]